MTRNNLKDHLPWLLANIDLSKPTAPVLPNLRDPPSADSSPSDESKYFTPTAGLSPTTRPPDIQAPTPLYPSLPVDPSRPSVSTSTNGSESRPENNRRGENVAENMGRLVSRSTSKRPGLTLRQEQLLSPASTTAPASIARDFSAQSARKPPSPRRAASNARAQGALLTPGPTRPTAPSHDSIDVANQDDTTSASSFFGSETQLLWREDYASRAEPLPSSENSVAFGSEKLLWDEEHASRPAPLETEENSDVFGSDIMIWEEGAAMRPEPLLSAKRGKKRKSGSMSEPPTTTTTTDEFPDILDLLGDDESVLLSHRKRSPTRSPARSKLKTSPTETPSKRTTAADLRQKRKNSPGGTPSRRADRSPFKTPRKELRLEKPAFSEKKNSALRPESEYTFDSGLEDIPEIQPKSQKSVRHVRHVVLDSDDEPLTPSPVKAPRQSIPRTGSFSRRPPQQGPLVDDPPVQSTPSKSQNPIPSQVTAILRSPQKSQQHQSQSQLSQPAVAIKEDESIEDDLGNQMPATYDDGTMSAILELFLEQPSIIDRKRLSLDEDLRQNKEKFKKSLLEGSIAPREGLRRDKEQITKHQLSLDVLASEYRAYEDLAVKRDALVARVADAYEHDLNTDDDESHLQELHLEMQRRQQAFKEWLSKAGIDDPSQFEAQTASIHPHGAQSFVQATQPGGPSTTRPYSRDSGNHPVLASTEVVLQTQLTPRLENARPVLDRPSVSFTPRAASHHPLAAPSPGLATSSERIQRASTSSAALRPQVQATDDFDDYDEEMFEYHESLPTGDSWQTDPAVQAPSNRKKGKTPRKEPPLQKQQYESDYSDGIDLSELPEIELPQSSTEARRLESSRQILSETSGNVAPRKEKSTAKSKQTSDLATISPQQRSYPWFKDVRRALKDRFRMSGFRHNQLEAINATLSGKDAFILMPTGGGKSLCYQLPAVIASGRTSGVTVVVSPLLSLMQDQVDHLSRLNIRARTFNGDTPAKERREILENLKHKFPENQLNLLYVTPEMINKSQQFLSGLSNLYHNNKLARLVIDEAHCVSQWGHDFRPDYKELGSFREQFPEVPLMALTATATRNVIVDVKHNLGIDECENFSQSFNRPNLFYEVRKKEKGNTAIIAELINSTYPGKTGIVYTLARKSAETIAEKLREEGVDAHHYHAAMKVDEKARVQRDWQKGKIKVVVATIAFGMGIDKPDVRFVIHQSVPKSLEGYYQETGRAGRDGQQSECYLYFSYGDVTSLRKMIHDGDGSHEQKERQRNMLAAVTAFCDNQSDCRRVEILRYFGETFSKAECNRRCDNCLSNEQFETKDFTRYAIAVLEIVKSEVKVTMAQCTDYLMAKKTKKDYSEGVQQYHGMAKSVAKHDIHRVIDRLAAEEALREDNVISKKIKMPVQYFRIGRNSRSYLANGRTLRLTTRIKSGESQSGPSNPQRRLVKPAAPATRPEVTSTYVSSPARKAASKRKGKAVAVVDEDSDEDFNAHSHGYSRDDGFVMDDDEEDSDIDVQATSRRRRRTAGSVGPPISRDVRMDAENLTDLQRDVLQSFFEDALTVEERVRTSKGIRQPIFSQQQLREMGLRWTVTLEQMRRIPGIDQAQVDRYGAKLLPLIKQYHQQYQEMMGDTPSIPRQSSEIVDLVSSDDDPNEGDEEMADLIDDDIDYDDMGEEASAYFEQPRAAPRSAYEALRDSSQTKMRPLKTSGGGSGSAGPSKGGKKTYASGGARGGRKKSYQRRSSGGSSYGGVRKKGAAGKRGSTSSSQQGTSRAGARGGRGGGRGGSSGRPSGVGFAGIALMDH